MRVRARVGHLVTPLVLIVEVGATHLVRGRGRGRGRVRVRVRARVRVRVRVRIRVRIRVRVRVRVSAHFCSTRLPVSGTSGSAASHPLVRGRGRGRVGVGNQPNPINNPSSNPNANLDELPPADGGGGHVQHAALGEQGGARVCRVARLEE